MSDYTDRLINHADGISMIAELRGIRNAIGIAGIIGQGVVPDQNSITFKGLQMMIQQGLGPIVAPLGSVISVFKETALVATVGEHTGEISVAVNESVFLEKVHEAVEGEYEFKYDGSAWRLDDHSVIIEDYGITITGTPTSGDTFLVKETAAVYKFRVVDYIEDGKTLNGADSSITFVDKTRKHGIVLLMEDIDYYGLTFSQPQALYVPDEVIPAGTTLSFGKGTYDATYAPDTVYHFTTETDIPAGAQICLSWGYQSPILNGKINVYSDPASTTVMQSLPIAAGNAGTYIGDASLSDRKGNLNHIQSARYGYNGWAESFARQNANSAGAKATYYQASSKFDRKPGVADSLDGFMKGFDAGFLDIVQMMNVETCKNSVSDATSAEITAGTAYTVTKDKFFMASRANIYGSRENASEKLDHWAWFAANTADAFKIRYNGNVARYWWLRSPHSAHAHYVRNVYPSGGLHNSYAYNGGGRCLACVIG